MLTVALAGKPNAGKSTFFEAATRDPVEAANYPFTTIDPNHGVAHVRTRCPCLDREERCGNDTCRDGKRYVPIELLDVAGLVPGAHEGRGLGNQFLDELTNADAVIAVVDAAGATNAEGEPVEVGSYDPVEEVDFVESELVEWLADILDRNWETIERRSRSPDFDVDDALADVLTGFGASEADVAACLRAIEYPDDPKHWDDEDRHALAEHLRRETKPILVAANKMDVAPAEHLERLLDLDRPVVPTTAEGELALRRAAEADLVDYDPGDDDFEIVGDVSDEQRGALEDLQDTVRTYDGTGVQEALNEAIYGMLDRITAYPVEDQSKWTDATGTVLPDAHLLRRGATPRDLAFAVHSDIGEGYLHAVDARSSRDVGDDKELEEGDVVKIVSTA
ncbi:translation-associated GTPase [Salinarchaeum sp. Harcht-Bsk1]|uniref:redox-regulated ATPase YchF n=1 Tax=Salinarchaeum sp. Harcht-Bsk1 TaxID=1333523 RepID=UPI000342452F|nr:redox-regulated ATPase YchF [Salinarchaeum sp. Harcht-Bsk1]AGN01485.1 translation-associated GTPase [Salinarchaeum sp. Harcht-Bsk1]